MYNEQTNTQKLTAKAHDCFWRIERIS